MLSPEIKQIFETKLNSLNIKYTIQIDDVSRFIQQQMESNRIEKRSIGFDYNKYQNLERINKWMDDFALKHSKFVEIFEITKSYEGRSIRAFKISTSTNQIKPAIWIDGAIHAREWITASTVIYITHLVN
jgi:carboxypeptidase A4